MLPAASSYDDIINDDPHCPQHEEREDCNEHNSTIAPLEQVANHGYLLIPDM
jgi:hypothetical protein